MSSINLSNTVFQSFINILPFRWIMHSHQMMKCNYNCPVCRLSSSNPNIAGRFFIINTTQCQCNGCNTVFEKEMFYAQPENPDNLDGKWVFSISDNADIKSEAGTQPESVI